MAQCLRPSEKGQLFCGVIRQAQERAAVLERELLGRRVDVSGVLIMSDGEERTLGEDSCSPRDNGFGKDSQPFGTGGSDLIHLFVLRACD